MDLTKSIVDSAPFPIGVYVGKEMRIELANQSIMDVWGKGTDVVGKNYADVLPELAESGIYKQLQGVYATGTSYHATNQKVDLLIAGQLRPFYFNYCFTPLFDSSGQVYGVMNTAADVTELNIAQQKLEQSERNFRNMILQSPAAMCLMLGEENRVEVANDLILKLWGTPSDRILGKPISEGLPGSEGKVLERILKEVYQTGRAYRAVDQPVTLSRDGKTEIVYQNSFYEPYRDADGNTVGIMATTMDVTHQVVALRQIQENYNHVQELNTQLATINDTLLNTQNHLEKVIQQLEQSESRLKNIMRQAPVAIGVLRGKDQIIEYGNKAIMEIWGKTEVIFGKPLGVAFPELDGQPFHQILSEVFASGKPYSANEALVKLEHDGQLKEIFSNFVYQPIQNEAGETTEIIVVAIDVTEQVISRKTVENVEESLRLATQAAELAPWSMNPKTGKWTTSAQLRKIFGFDENEEIKPGSAFERIREDYKQTVSEAIKKSVVNGDPFQIEYPIIEAINDQERWVKSVGKMLYNYHGDEPYLTGVLIDITEEKRELQRKNDFIGMVSHELKTPLTSLVAIIQVLHRKLKDSEDSFLSGALEKATSQVRRMSAIINGFLNMSRLESGKLQIDKVHFNLHKMLSDVCNEFALITHHHQINLVSCDDLIVFADKEKIESVVSNLISNAVKYSPAGSAISLTCKIDGGNVLVAIADEGMGISQHDLTKIFDRYYRVEGSNSKHISGFGIGLYLSYEIVDLHDGEIWAESKEGSGSTFYFTLPLESSAVEV